MTKVRVGLVGTGLIAQVMHLHYLTELADYFDVAAVCDLDREGARACAERYGIPAAFTDWRELDILPRSAERFARAAAEQRHNREFLAARGL